jgi:hypothetical protein
MVFRLTSSKIGIGNCLSDVCPLFIQEAATNQDGLKLNASKVVIDVTVIYSCHRIL